jgi:pyruvate,orthophosphate dikinase
MNPPKKDAGVKIPPAPDYSILQEVVSEYPGVLGSTTPLFHELQQETRNWPALLKELRAYALKNFSLHDHHARGVEAILTVIDIFLEAVNVSGQEMASAALDGLLVYLEKVIMDGGQKLEAYGPAVRKCSDALRQLPQETFSSVISNPHQLKKAGRLILDRRSEEFDVRPFNALYFRYLSETYDYWLKQEDPADRLKDSKDVSLTAQERNKLDELFFPVAHENLTGLKKHLEGIGGSGIDDPYSTLEEMLKLPSFAQITAYYEDLIGILPGTGDDLKDFGLKTEYLMDILKTEGLADIHESSIREMGRTLAAFIKSGGPSQMLRMEAILAPPITALKEAFAAYPDITLHSIQIVGSEIYHSGESAFVEWFGRQIISFGFQYPKVKGITDEWQLISNKAHLKNIRVWLDLIEMNPKWSKALISALMINLTLAGVNIVDTDLFQKNITKLLNSDIKPVYHIIKQLAKVFPAYFNVINAEGELREVSTALDDATRTHDPLVRFLRKHSHIESSSVIIDFAEEVMRFWLTKDKRPLAFFLPEDVYGRISESGPFVDDLHLIFTTLLNGKGTTGVTDLLGQSEDDIIGSIKDLDVSAVEKRRAWLAVRFYQMLYAKYRLTSQGIREQLKQSAGMGLPSAESLITVLEQGGPQQRISAVLDYLEQLKDIILAPEKFEAIEDIARKRHIAAGIPSMYGRYIEKKFNALSMTFRLENLANIYFEELINSINLTYITRATLVEIEKYANLFFRSLRLDGISSNRLENTLELLSGSLEVKRFSFSQYIDIFRGFADAVQDIVNTYCSGIHKGNLKVIIPQIGMGNMMSRYGEAAQGKSEFEFINTVAEQFLRETVSSSLSLQQLDVFISRILKTLFEQGGGLDMSNLDLLMSYDQKRALSDIHSSNSAASDRIHLGNKGYNLAKLAALGVKVPPGFIITTEVFRCREAIGRFSYAAEHLNECIEEELRHLEERSGKLFGNPDNPLLVSVRSGGAISMPGMMDSLLNVGINESIVEGLIRQKRKGWFAWDCYRRFLQSWGMSFGMERDVFDAIIDSYKKKYRVGLKIEFSPDQMKGVALAYKKIVADAGIEVSDDPIKQLHGAIDLVFKSWMSAKAKDYRDILSLSENWGTAVIVQEMIYGNLDTGAGTGVLFTRNPREPGDRVMLWGDFMTGAQGEDIVAGLVKTLPISNEQKRIEERADDYSLEDLFPAIHHHLLRIMKDLIYEQGWGAQEIEFTFEGADPENLQILQARDMALTRGETFMAFIPSPELSDGYLSNGIGVGGGALSGKAAFDLEDIRRFKGKDPTTPVILLRADTVPDDIRQISAADGLLTARGGSTSHAAIIANRLGKTCVVGCNKLVVLEHDKKCRLDRKTIKAGDFLSIDGRNGSVYLGMHKVKEVMPLT